MEIKKIDTINKLHEFLRSSKDEAEFFGLDKNDYISMKEYVERLNYLNNLYFLRIKSPFMSLTKKNRWVKDIQPNFNQNNEHVLDVIDYRGNTTPIIKEYDTYICPFGSSRREEKLCKNSNEELKEIDEISKKIDLSEIKNREETLSNNFLITVKNFNTPIVTMNLKFLISKEMNYEEVEALLSDYHTAYATYLIQNKTLSNSKEQVVKKLYLKK